MRFRPCIDIHNGKVKQIVGSSLRDEGDAAEENFVSQKSAVDFAKMYDKDGLAGGHVILLNSVTSSHYEETKRQALAALSARPGTLQVGGGINPDNAAQFLDAGASHVIVTSYVFRDGQINEENLYRMVETVGREHLVLDLSCKKSEDGYRIVTDRWQKMTDVLLTEEVLDRLAHLCDEFLVHAVDVEGMNRGPEAELVHLLGSWHGLPITYAGGIGSFEDIELLAKEGKRNLDFTIGSALDLFGGDMPYEKVKLIR